MARLPTVGGDQNAWGTVLETYLEVGHNADGSNKFDEIHLSAPKYGANLNGNNDDAALAAAMADVPVGGKLVLPAALIGFSAWSPRPDMHVAGLGYFNLANAAFGNSQWATTGYGTTFGGTVLVSSVTSGAAVTVAGTSADTCNGSLKDVMILGPGTGTSTGLQLGSSSHFLSSFECDVLVCNFDNGVQQNKVEDCELHLRVRACGAVGIADDSSTNNNLYPALEVQFAATTGLSVTGSGNTYDTPLIQDNTGAPMAIGGTGNTMVTPWIENASAGSASTWSCNQGTVINPRFNAAADTFTMSGSNNTYICASGDGRTANTISGNSNTLVGTFAHIPTLSGTSNRVYGFPLRMTAVASSNDPLIFNNEGTDQFQYYQNGGSAHLFLRDLVNSVQVWDYNQSALIANLSYTLEMKRGWGQAITSITSSSSIATTVNVVVCNGSSITATLPAANSLDAGRIITVKNINSTSLTVAPHGADDIDGANSSKTLAQWGYAQYMGDGSANWYQIG